MAWVLLALFLVSWGGQAWSEWRVYEGDQRAHDQETNFVGGDGFVAHFAQSTLENWQSEFLQLLTFVVLTAYLSYKGSPESKSTDDEIHASLARIERRLGTLEKPGQAQGA